MKAMLLTKSCHWSYEEEYRLFRVRGQTEDMPTHSTFAPELLDGIVLGAEISGEDEGKILEILESREPRVEVLRAERSRKSFELHTQPIFE